MNVTPLEQFLKMEDEAAELDEIKQDINTLYAVINGYLNCHSIDYRCYITPQRELIVVLLKKIPKVDLNEFSEKIDSDTVMSFSYGIESVKIKAQFDFEGRLENLSANNKQKNEFDDIIISESNVFTLHTSHSELLQQHIPYDIIFKRALGIDGISQATLFSFVPLLVKEDIESSTQKSTISRRDRYLIRNTIDIFESDIRETEGFGDMITHLDNIQKFFHPDEEKESTGGSMDKVFMPTLTYLLDADAFPFQSKIVTIEGREIHTKFYLFLCSAYHFLLLHRIFESEKSILDNRKRNREAIIKMLSGEKTARRGSSLEKYLMRYNPNYSPGQINNSDTALLQILLSVIDKRKGDERRMLAATMDTLFGKRHNQRNRLLNLLGLTGIGQYTKCEI